MLSTGSVGPYHLLLSPTLGKSILSYHIHLALVKFKKFHKSRLCSAGVKKCHTYVPYIHICTVCPYTQCSSCAVNLSDSLSPCSYTGTQVCCDPVRRVITILLTNRCYKDDTAHTKELIALTRRLFNDAVVQVLPWTLFHCVHHPLCVWLVCLLILAV